MVNESLYNELLRQLTRATSGTSTASSLTKSSTLGSGSTIPAETLIQPTASTETKSSGFDGKVASTGINFGKPSQSVQSVSGGSTNWLQLASNVASGGLTSILGGAGSLGLGSIVSGLLGLFGGGGSKSLPALPLFALPNPQDVTVYVGGNSSTVYQGSMDQAVVPKSQTPIYSGKPGTSVSASSPGTPSSSSLENTAARANAPAPAVSANTHAPKSASTVAPSTNSALPPTDVNSQWFMERSNDIAAAVRNAMLNSSSLNDVVAEV